jgi:23S rRNA pseudouridine1911/1915/1917 synthase
VSDEEPGQDAVTHFEVVERRPQATLVRIQLETGRRNQIRVHFAEAGHPVLGDTRYGADQWDRELWPHERLALHAQLLVFQHPLTGAELRYETPLPDEFNR